MQNFDVKYTNVKRVGAQLVYNLDSFYLLWIVYTYTYAQIHLKNWWELKFLAIYRVYTSLSALLSLLQFASSDNELGVCRDGRTEKISIQFYATFATWRYELRVLSWDGDVSYMHDTCETWVSAWQKHFNRLSVWNNQHNRHNLMLICSVMRWYLFKIWKVRILLWRFLLAKVKLETFFYHASN